MAKASRDKGARGEREVVDLFEAAGLKAYRSAALQAGDVEGAADVTVRDFPGLHVEVKRCERYELPAWERQADEAAGDDTPIVFYRRNGEPWRAVVPGAWLAELLDNYLSAVRYAHPLRIMNDQGEILDVVPEAGR